MKKKNPSTAEELSQVYYIRCESGVKGVWQTKRKT
jgi:hypothetical protein